jgi:hypothetical protein
MADVNSKDIALYGQNKDVITNPDLSSGKLASYGWLTWTPSYGGLISDHIERTINLLIEQFRVDRPFITTLVQSVAKSCQEIENVLYDLIRFRTIALSTGIQLDAIGSVVGCSRTSADDEVYRSDIYFQIYLNKSGGEPETLISALQRVTGATIDYSEPATATVLLMINKFVRSLPSNLKTKMKSLTAAGVSLELRYSNSDNQFIFNGDLLDSSETEPFYISQDPFFVGSGFAELYSDSHIDVGGSFVELIEA